MHKCVHTNGASSSPHPLPTPSPTQTVLDLGVTIPGFDLPHAIYLDAIDVNVRVVLRQRLLQHVWLSLP